MTRRELELLQEALEMKMNAWLKRHSHLSGDESPEYLEMLTLFERTCNEQATMRYLEVSA